MLALHPAARRGIKAGVVLFASSLLAASTLNASPLPMGTSTMSVSYPTDAGIVTLSGDRGFNGTGPNSVPDLTGGPNHIRAFSGVNYPLAFRVRVPGAKYLDESIIYHGFYKDQGFYNEDFFPGITEGANVTIKVENIQFDQPVQVDRSTFMFHVLWNLEQVDQLEHPYHHGHNAHTATDPFRDLDLFLAEPNIFSDQPVPNYVLGDVSPIFTGEGTDTLTMSFTFPYDLLKNLEEEGHAAVPPGLPAPHGFLEPYHFHIEYAVTPEPVTLGLILPALAFVFRRRKSS